MQTLEVSDEAYKKIMSRRVGSEAVSTTLLRVLSSADDSEIEGGWDTEKLDADLNRSLKESKKLYSHEEVFR